MLELNCIFGLESFQPTSILWVIWWRLFGVRTLFDLIAVSKVILSQSFNPSISMLHKPLSYVNRAWLSHLPQIRLKSFAVTHPLMPIDILATVQTSLLNLGSVLPPGPPCVQSLLAVIVFHQPVTTVVAWCHHVLSITCSTYADAPLS